MGKDKKKKKKRSKLFGAKPITGPGDLTKIPEHVEEWIKGNEDAANALQMMGRDAAFTVIQIAEEKNHDDLKEFGQRLVPIKPELETNMMQLRKLSVMELARAVMAEAPLAVESTVEVEGGAVSFFDPENVGEDLARGGRPRNDPARVGAGDVVWFGLPSNDPTSVTFSTETPPEGQETIQLPLKVQSGLIFVGPPSASDGPRMGTVRLDPFTTNLHHQQDKGRFVRVKPGDYALLTFLNREGVVQVHLNPASEARPSELYAAGLLLPTQVDADATEE